MKTLDFLIVLLSVMVLASGGTLVYLVVTGEPVQDNSNNTQLENGNKNNVATVSNNNPVIPCVDTDGDKYGEGCELGKDCDDEDRNRNTTCEVMKGKINLITEATGLKVGEQIELKVVLEGIEDVSTESGTSTIELRLDYSTDVLKYVSFTPNSESGYTLPIELDTKNRIVIDMAGWNGLKTGDTIGTFTFEAVVAGEGEVKFAKDTRLNVVYEIEGGEYKVTIGE